MMITKHLFFTALLGATLLACGSATPAPSEPTDNTGETTDPGGEAAPGNALTGATTVEISRWAEMGGQPTSRTVSDPAAVEAMVAAAGPTATPGGSLRKCPDTIALAFADGAGASLGTVGFCNSGGALTADSPLEGPQLTRGSDTIAVTLADEPALRALVLANWP